MKAARMMVRIFKYRALTIFYSIVQAGVWALGILDDNRHGLGMWLLSGSEE